MKPNTFNIPGLGDYHLKNLFIDYNGTIASSGQLLINSIENLNELAKFFNVYIITGDTFNNVRNTFKDTSINVLIAYTALEKKEIIEKYDPESCVAIGNGSIDAKMFDSAKLSICIIGPEGASLKAINASDILVNTFDHAVEMLLSPKKIIATLKE